MSRDPGEISLAIRNGYRVATHVHFFPFTHQTGTIVHAVVDHGARAVFCSAEWARTYQEAKGAT